MSKNTRLLRLRQLIGDPKANPPLEPIIPFSKSSIYRLIAEGKFPKPVKLSERSVAWRESEINDFLSQLQKS